MAFCSYNHSVVVNGDTANWPKSSTIVSNGSGIYNVSLNNNNGYFNVRLREQLTVNNYVCKSLSDYDMIEYEFLSFPLEYAYVGLRFSNEKNCKITNPTVAYSRILRILPISSSENLGKFDVALNSVGNTFVAQIPWSKFNLSIQLDGAYSVWIRYFSHLNTNISISNVRVAKYCISTTTTSTSLSRTLDTSSTSLATTERPRYSTSIISSSFSGANGVAFLQTTSPTMTSSTSSVTSSVTSSKTSSTTSSTMTSSTSSVTSSTSSNTSSTSSTKSSATSSTSSKTSSTLSSITSSTISMTSLTSSKTSSTTVSFPISTISTATSFLQHDTLSSIDGSITDTISSTTSSGSLDSTSSLFSTISASDTEWMSQAKSEFPSSVPFSTSIMMTSSDVVKNDDIFPSVIIALVASVSGVLLLSFFIMRYRYRRHTKFRLGPNMGGSRVNLMENMIPMSYTFPVHSPQRPETEYIDNNITTTIKV